MKSVSIDINELNDYQFNPNEYVSLFGTASADLRITNQKLPHFQAASVVDFTGATIGNDLNFKIENSANIICYKPVIDMSGRSDTALQMEKNSINCVLVEPSVTGGSNGIRTTSGATRCLVYRGNVQEAAIDAFTAHRNADGICGDGNYFIQCEGKTADSGGEEAFDCTSGNDHIFIDCKASDDHQHGLMNVGRGSSATVINPFGAGVLYGGPNQALTVKWVQYCNIVGGQVVTRFILDEQTEDEEIVIPQNVRWYGAPPLDLRNPSGLDLDAIYSNDPYAMFEFPPEQKEDLLEKLDLINELFYS